MATMNFARATSDVGDPTGVVIRAKPDGMLNATIVEGDDKNVVMIARLLVMMIEQVGMTDFLPMARSAGEAAGFDMDAMIKSANSESAVNGVA